MRTNAEPDRIPDPSWQVGQRLYCVQSVKLPLRVGEQGKLGPELDRFAVLRLGQVCLLMLLPPELYPPIAEPDNYCLGVKNSSWIALWRSEYRLSRNIVILNEISRRSSVIRCHLGRLLGERRMKIADLARETGVHRNALTLLYREEATRIDVTTIDKVCAFFGCKVGDLLEYIPGSDSKPK